MLCTGDGRRSYTLIGHREEISSAVYNYDASMIATGSMVQLILYEYTHIPHNTLFITIQYIAPLSYTCGGVCYLFIMCRIKHVVSGTLELANA